MKAEGQIPGCLTTSAACRRLRTNQSVQAEGLCWRRSAQGQDESRRGLGKALVALPGNDSRSSLTFLQQFAAWSFACPQRRSQKSQHEMGSACTSLRRLRSCFLSWDHQGAKLPCIHAGPDEAFYK